MTNRETFHFGPLVPAGILLGIGMGGFFDGILFHQLLQAHNLFSATSPKLAVTNVEMNPFWDGLFHAFAWLTTAAGLALLGSGGKHAEVTWSTRAFLGSLVLGWGFFNLIEGVLDHHLLQIHYALEGLELSVFDYALPGSGVALMLLGSMLILAGRKRDVQHVIHPGMVRRAA